MDVLHCLQRRFWEPEFHEIDGGSGLDFAGWAKKLTGAATISVGFVGRALLADPLWVDKVHAGNTAALGDFTPPAIAELM